MKRDKLDRYRTPEMAVLTQEAGVPFWVTLTARERSGKAGLNLTHEFLRMRESRKQFRDFIRSLACSLSSTNRG